MIPVPPNNPHNPVLSIVIPTFEYAIGIRRILRILSEDCPSSIEILISDDSLSDEVFYVVKEYAEASQKIFYHRNCPSLGASENWNAVLERAKGKYCLLMHHDEFPLSPFFIESALSVLRKHPKIDVLMMDCLLVSDNGKIARRHVPNLIRTWIVRHAPSYLFRRNLIGPTSVLIIRRSLYPKFDGRLRWLVDVEAYFRLRRSTNCWHTCEHLQIGSLLGRCDSITANMGAKIKEIRRQELEYLALKHPEASLWLHTNSNQWIYALESTLWALMRVLTRLYGCILSLFNILPTKKKNLKR